MKEEQLNKEAIIYSANIKASYPEDVDDNTLEYECHKAFLKGARWHESLPLSEKLSESDKAKIIMLQEEIHGEIMCAHDDDDWQSAAHYILDAMPRAFERIFGKDLFTKSE